jgi:hypothetical protein
LVEAGGQAEFLLDDGDQDVNGDRNPDLASYRILTGAIESLDSQVLLDPLEQLTNILPINTAHLK